MGHRVLCAERGESDRFAIKLFELREGEPGWLALQYFVLRKGRN